MSVDAAVRDRLLWGLDALGIEVADVTVAKLLDYIELLVRWNRAYSLTAVREPQQMVTRHLLDSLAVLPWFTGARKVLDIGSGAGLPGIPLALALPDTRFVLCEANAKKQSFLRQAIADLALANVAVEPHRVELLEPAGFDVITARAFAPVARIVALCAALLVPGVRLLLLKGDVADELAELTPPGEITVHPLAVPGLAERRCLVDIVVGNAPAVGGGHQR